MDIQDRYGDLTTKYNKRFNRIKKKKFRKYIKEGYEDRGYRVYEDKGIVANNLYIGNIEAEKVLVAHYDTPPNMFLFLIFNNSFGTKLGQILIVLVMLSSLYIVGWMVPRFYGIYTLIITLYIISVFIVGNKNNFNDNTSGVLTVLTFFDNLSESQKNEYLIVLTDNEEKGLFGAFKFKKFLKKNKLGNKKIIVVDCVGIGEEYAIISLGENKNADYFYEKNVTKYQMKRYTSKILVSDNGALGKDSFLISKVSKSKYFNKPTIKNMHTNKDNKLDLNNIIEVHCMIKNFFEI